MIELYDEDRPRVDQLRNEGRSIQQAAEEAKREKAIYLLQDLWYDGKIDQGLSDILEFILRRV